MVKRWAFFYGWVVVLAVGILSFGSTGARFSFSVFFEPMTKEFGWSATALSGAVSLNFLLAGLIRPLGGWLVDRYGPKLLAVWGVAICALVMGLFSFVTELWQAYALFMLLAIGYVAGPVTTAKMVGSWFVRRRALALSVASTGTALGELVVQPLAMWMLIMASWQISSRMISIMLFAIMLPVGLILLKNSPADKKTYPDGDSATASAATIAAHDASSGNATLTQALRSPTFWQLATGFFVCGLTMSFANTHLITFAMADHGIDRMVAATASGFIGGFSILGSLSLGALSDFFGRKNVLATVYFLRGLAFVIMLGIDSPFTLFVASSVLGISWTATTPLTSAITADLWGLKSLGAIFGSMFAVMTLGSAVGVTVDGWVFDTHGSYQIALWINVFAGLIAGTAVMLIREKKLTRKEKPAMPIPVSATDGAKR